MPVNSGAEPLTAVARILACPECGDTLTVRDRSLVCARRHSFDIARQGYVSLLTGASTKMTGDTADMLDARAAFQGERHFAPIADALVAALSAATPNPRTLLEIGSGTGYYLAAALDALPNADGIALDVAKPAARRGARAHPRAASILADAWRGLPVRDAALTHVLSVFAPRNPDEVARVLDPGGLFVVVAPTHRHLAELIEPLGMVSVDSTKDDRLAEALSGRFERIDRELVEYPMKLGHTDIGNVAAMGPSAHHAAAARSDRIAALPEFVQVTASVTVSSYRPR
ncbi:putative RNA methyltransferase [Nocardia pseudobrasiliensis]|uniref:23S rRNA m(1)G-748 methyltransferase n=1 Tax=Nocardia pseudobrasiliensis TaxID=45979 RepID=A0A370ICW1_9NOCA|nr:methyltransferase domain-containing protein [Nocardia pseudobrasiliensis]RDI68569.1 23S rRNA m(1)G-748 methyltransferase [Nocardia pseudobrasiliensis]